MPQYNKELHRLAAPLVSKHGPIMSKGTGYFRPRSRDEVVIASSQSMPVPTPKSADNSGTSNCDQDRVKPADSPVAFRGSSCGSSSSGASSNPRSTRPTVRGSRFAATGNPPFTSQFMNTGACAINRPVQLSSPSGTLSSGVSLAGAFSSGEHIQLSAENQAYEGGFPSTSSMLYTPVLWVAPPTAHIHSWDEQVTAAATVGTRNSAGGGSGSMLGYTSTGVPPTVQLTAATSNPSAASHVAAGTWPAEHGSLSTLGSCSAINPVLHSNGVSAMPWQQDQLLVMPECSGLTLQANPAAQTHSPQLACQQHDLALLQLQQEYEAASAQAAAVLQHAQARLAAVQVQSPPRACSQQLLQCSPVVTSTSFVGGAGLAAGTNNSAALMACGQLDSTVLQQQLEQLQQLQQQLQQLQVRQPQPQLQQSLLPTCVGGGVLAGYAGGTPLQLVTSLAAVTPSVTVGWAPGPCLADPSSLLRSGSSSSSGWAPAAMYTSQGSSTPMAPGPAYCIAGGQVVMGNDVAAVAAAAARVAYCTPAQAQHLVAMQVPMGR